MVNQDHNRPVIVYSYDPKDGHESDKIVDTALGYDDPCGRWKCISIINQAKESDGPGNHLICPMKCRLNCVNVSETPKGLADSPSVTTAIQAINSLNDIHPLIIPL